MLITFSGTKYDVCSNNIPYGTMRINIGILELTHEFRALQSNNHPYFDVDPQDVMDFIENIKNDDDCSLKFSGLFDTKNHIVYKDQQLIFMDSKIKITLTEENEKDKVIDAFIKVYNWMLDNEELL